VGNDWQLERLGAARVRRIRAGSLVLGSRSFGGQKEGTRCGRVFKSQSDLHPSWNL
jgi:hypothetical protein